MENERLKTDLAAANDACDREVAMRMRDEAESTLKKVEELWRVSAENEKLKEQLAASQIAVQTLLGLVASMDVEQGDRHSAYTAACTEAVAARAEVSQLENALATFNRHAVGLGQGLCNGCGGLYSKAKQLESATMRSQSPRFGNAAAHARLGAKAGSNPMVPAKKAHPGPGAHQAQRDNRGSFNSIGLSSMESYTASATTG